VTEIGERGRVTSSRDKCEKIGTEPIGPVPGPDGPWFVRHRFLLLATGVTVLTSIQTANGQWSSDMWEHVAVVRGLIDDPFSAPPGLSLLTTPYTVMLGLLGNLLDVSAVTILSVAAVANVVLLLAAFRLFVLEATQNERAPFWALVFLLLLWGPSPYRFSGFFNLNSIGFVLPYPSAFATAIALLVLMAAQRASRDCRWQWFAIVTAGTATVVLVHPITGLWLAVGIFAVAVSRMREARGWIWLVGAGALGVAVTFAWPYFRLIDLVGETDAGPANRAMYEDVLLRLLPAAVIGLWVIWRRQRVDRRDLFGLVLGGALAIYAFGYVTDEYVYGRSLVLVVLVLDVAAGDGIGRVEESFQWRRASGWVRAGAVTLGALLVFGLINTRGGLVRMVPTGLLPASVRTSDQLTRVDDQYEFLSRFVSGDDVVIGATDQDNRVIPAIAGQPLRPFWKAPGPRDATARAQVQAEFLDPNTGSARRREIQARFNVRFVLLHPGDSDTDVLVRTLESEGAKVVYNDNGLRLVALPAGQGTS
jgi:hypothetical protein